jgi:hypothetical protein
VTVIAIAHQEPDMVTRNVEDVIKQIAAATNTPEETVSRMYQETWAEYSDAHASRTT